MGQGGAHHRDQRIAQLLSEIAGRDRENRSARCEIQQLESEAAAADRSRQEARRRSLLTSSSQRAPSPGIAR
jgi:hypothetical protein